MYQFQTLFITTRVWIGQINSSSITMSFVKPKGIGKLCFSTSLMQWLSTHTFYTECTLNPLSHYEFRENLVRSPCCTATPDYSILVGKRQQSTASINVDHCLVGRKTMRQCVYCSLVHKEKHRTTRQCAECEVSLMLSVLRLLYKVT